MTSLPISLPDGFSPSIKAGDQVTSGQIIATRILNNDEIINIPKLLGIKRSHVKNVLKKSPGDLVKQGDIIAQKKSLLGTKSVALRSRVSGTILRYERDSGNLVIKTGASVNSDKENVISPVDGKAVLCNNNEIVLETNKEGIIGSKSVGGKGEGEVLVLLADDPYYLNTQTIGKIVVGESLTQEMLLKAIGIGVMGMIGTKVNDEDIELIQEKKFDMPILEITKESREQLIEWSGKKVFLDAESKSIVFLQL